MAELMARAVLCQSGGTRPCDVCDSCKKCLNGMHPDIHEIAPEKNTIKVEQIRDLQDTMALTSYAGGMKIAIIRRADCMNVNAQNALLKTLENPTGDALFFLLTEAPSALLPTVVSRCLTVRFRCLEPAACAEVLQRQGVAHERAALLAALSQGSAASAKIGDVKDNASAVFEILELWARDLMRVQNGLMPMQVADEARLRASRHRGSALMLGVAQLRRQLAANVTWTNALDAMLFQLVRA